MEEPRALINVVTVLTVFAVVFPAELPDKSLFASLVLGTRFRPCTCGSGARPRSWSTSSSR